MNYLFFLCLWLFGCAPSWSKPVVPETKPPKAVVCVDLPRDYLEDVEETLTVLNRSVGNWKTFVIGWENCSLTLKETTEEPWGFGEIAWVSEIGGSQIFLLRGRYEWRIHGVLLHEMFHALGAQHVDGTLMDPIYNRLLTWCPDQTTVAQVAAWNHADLRLFSWCRY